MSRLVFIVARHQPELYDYIKREFAGNDDVDVIVDRRLGDRRLRQVAVPDQRRVDRRQEHIDERLRSLGWAIVWQHEKTTVYARSDATTVGQAPPPASDLGDH